MICIIQNGNDVFFFIASVLISAFSAIMRSQIISMSDIFTSPLNVSTLLVALASLIVAIVSFRNSQTAFKLSQRIFAHTAKDYIPDFKIEIKANDDIQVSNNSKDLFTIKNVCFVKIEFFGFENADHKTFVQLPFITKSSMQWLIDKSQRVTFKNGRGGACAYNICPYDEKMVAAISKRIESEYSMNSSKGYALPSLQSLQYLVEVVYDNNFQERKSVIYLKKHVH